MSSGKYFCQIYQNLKFCGRLLYKFSLSNVTKVHPVGAALIHAADKQAGGTFCDLREHA
jgi:hypothetical protein